tara:strand:+ start:113465 stop:113941 length:477 start_codon:yes stop_codon:yes gene_type:complete
MKFIANLLLSIFKTVAVVVILIVIGISIIQKKFPPSYSETQELIQSAQKAYAVSVAMKAENGNLENAFNKGSLIMSRETLYTELKKLDPSMEDIVTPSKNTEKEKMPTLRDMNRRDLLILNSKLDQAEYKIRILEYEMKQLKDEYKKMKSSGAASRGH